MSVFDVKYNAGIFDTPYFINEKIQAGSQLVFMNNFRIGISTVVEVNRCKNSLMTQVKLTHPFEVGVIKTLPMKRIFQGLSTNMVGTGEGFGRLIQLQTEPCLEDD